VFQRTTDYHHFVPELPGYLCGGGTIR
jgi:hypothetical protein